MEPLTVLLVVGFVGFGVVLQYGSPDKWTSSGAIPWFIGLTVVGLWLASNYN